VPVTTKDELARGCFVIICPVGGEGLDGRVFELDPGRLGRREPLCETGADSTRATGAAGLLATIAIGDG